MDAAQAVKAARQRVGLSQRRLAVRSGIPQSAIARIESGRVVPRVDTLDRLLRSAGSSLEVAERPAGWGVDRTQIRELLKLTPDERLQLLTESARNLARFLAEARPSR